MSLMARTRREFGSGDRRRGEDVYESGAVRITTISKKALEAEVQGGRLYWVRLDWSGAPEGAEASCTCPRFDDGILCKHIWATICEAEESGLRFPGAGPVSIDAVSPDEWSEFDADDVLDDGALDEDQAMLEHDTDTSHHSNLLPFGDFSHSNEPGPTPTAQPTRGQAKPQPEWQQKLNKIEVANSASPIGLRAQPTYRFWFVIDATHSVTCKLPSIAVSAQQLKMDGTRGKHMKRGIDWVLRDGDASERVAAAYLENTYEHHGHGLRDVHRGSIRTGLRKGLEWPALKALQSTGRFAWALDPEDFASYRTITLDEGAPWQTSLAVQPAEDQLSDSETANDANWIANLQLTRESFTANETSALELRQFVATLGGGLLLFEDRITRADAHATQWAPHFADGPLRFRFGELEQFLATLGRFGAIPKLKMHASAGYVASTESPRGRLRLEAHPHRPFLSGTIEFLYSVASLNPDSGSSFVVDEQRRLMAQRDQAAEQTLMQQLYDAGLRNERYSYSNSDVELDAEKLPAAVIRLTELGWEVFADGRLTQSAGDFQFDVSSGQDWFDLQANANFGENVVPLPQILSALRSNERLIRLDDGSQGILPEAWLKRYGKLAELGTVEGESLRFGKSQALLLDALLSEQQHVSLDAPFRKLRKKLQAFDGVKPANAPKGFQGVLRNYQKEGLGWLKFLREFGFGGCLADDMGLGKTIQVLALLQSRRLRRIPNGESKKPSIAVVPKSLVFNWIDEAQRFAPKLNLVNYTGTNRKELFASLPCMTW